ncbi:MAG: hypothetical protein JWM34_3080 [Ilumatobacteraceae bacterium]|nr:hypothetical protein [Ilumatobacteraceae bacterium]
MSTIGVLGGLWRATVTPAGGVEPWDGSKPLDWFIAADDRWHVPADEPTVRQRRIDGAPVIETRMKVPSGDAVHRVWCVADDGGYTIIEIENDSTLPFAAAFNRNDLLSSRPPANVPIQGIDLPPDSIVLPVGHRATVRVALAHTAPNAGPLPDRLPSPMQVARGWTAIIDSAGRMVLPDAALLDRLAQLRGELALNGPVEPDDDVVGFLLDVGELVRLGERADPWVPDVAAAVTKAARLTPTWDTLAALDGAGVVLARAGEDRGLRDLARMRPVVATALPVDAPGGRELAWLEQRLARSLGGGTADLLGTGIPTAWLGANFEVYGLPVGPATTVSYAVRWHGDRPAVLWELDGPAVPLTASVVAPGWSTAEEKGEALWPAPVVAGASAIDLSSSGDISFN